jgi:hypothetical protein
LTEIHCLATDPSEKSINSLLVGSEAIPMDIEPKKRTQNARKPPAFEVIGFIA